MINRTTFVVLLVFVLTRATSLVDAIRGGGGATDLTTDDDSAESESNNAASSGDRRSHHRRHLPVVSEFAYASATDTYHFAVQAGTTKFWDMISLAETTVLELAKETEKAYEYRCEAETIQDCTHGSFEGCRSAFPRPVCLVVEDDDHLYWRSECNTNCGAVWDFTTSSISFPPLAATTDAVNKSSSSYDDDRNIHNGRSRMLDITESVCFTKTVDEFFVSKSMADQFVWKDMGLDFPPMMTVGINNGVARSYPAQSELLCNSYDPRQQPWYVGGSSGPKQILLLLDTSSSMANDNKLDTMKQAVHRILDALTVGDMVAVIPFHTAAYEYADEKTRETFLPANEDTKKALKAFVDDLEAGGSTNFLWTFRRAFEIMESASNSQDSLNTAILLLTDGAMTDPPGWTEAEVLYFVEEKLARLEQEHVKSPIHLLTYSFSHPQEEAAGHAFAKQLACIAPHGVWAKISGSSPDKVVEQFSSYYRVFGLTLGLQTNFTSWTLPYRLAGNYVQGVSVSSPVFDRSCDPPKLIGVASLHLPVSALSEALGVAFSTCDKETMNQQISKLLSHSTVVPRLEPSACLLEDFRTAGPAGDDASCDIDCPWVSSRSSLCYQPTDLLANRALESVSVEERTCCVKDEEGRCSCYAPHTEHPTFTPTLSLTTDPTVAPTILGTSYSPSDNPSDDPKVEVLDEDSNDTPIHNYTTSIAPTSPNGTNNYPPTSTGSPSASPTFDHATETPISLSPTYAGGTVASNVPSFTIPSTLSPTSEGAPSLGDPDGTPTFGSPTISSPSIRSPTFTPTADRSPTTDDPKNSPTFVDSPTNGGPNGFPTRDVDTPSFTPSFSPTFDGVYPPFPWTNPTPTISDPSEPASGGVPTVNDPSDPTIEGEPTVNSPTIVFVPPTSGLEPTVPPVIYSNETVDTETPLDSSNETSAPGNVSIIPSQSANSNDNDVLSSPLIWAGIVPLVIIGITGLVLLVMYGRNRGNEY